MAGTGSRCSGKVMVDREVGPENFQKLLGSTRVDEVMNGCG